MTHAEFQALLQRYLEGECTAAEAQQVEAWYAAMHRGQLLAGHAGKQQTSQRLWRGIKSRRRLAQRTASR